MKNSKINFWMVAFFCLIGILIGVGATYAVLKYYPSNTGDKEMPKKAEEIKKYSFNFDGFPALGSDSAEITIVEFADYQCPACGTFFSGTFNDLKTKYIDTNKIKFVFKDFPLFSIHPQAEMASEAVHCASEQSGEKDNYWEMHDLIFSRAKEWSGNVKAESVFNGFAKELKLDVKQFGECLKTGKYRDAVLASLKEGLDVGVEGTPTFYINGEKTFFGAYPIESFDAALAKLGVK